MKQISTLISQINEQEHFSGEVFLFVKPSASHFRFDYRQPENDKQIPLSRWFSCDETDSAVEYLTYIKSLFLFFSFNRRRM
jgi:hypothetical protein